MTTPAQDARRILHEVLREHADGPDPALAAAARAELAYRHQREREALLAAGRAIMESVARTAKAMAAVAGRIVEAVGGVDVVREVVRRREQGECVAHDTPGVPAVIEYDGDPVCEDCAVDYLHEDIDEATTDETDCPCCDTLGKMAGLGFIDTRPWLLEHLQTQHTPTEEPTDG